MPFVAEISLHFCLCHRFFVSVRDFGKNLTLQSSAFGQEVENQDGRICYELMAVERWESPRSGWKRFIHFLRGEVGSRKSAAFKFTFLQL